MKNNIRANIESSGTVWRQIFRALFIRAIYYHFAKCVLFRRRLQRLMLAKKAFYSENTLHILKISVASVLKKEPFIFLTHLTTVLRRDGDRSIEHVKSISTLLQSAKRNEG
jgi:hypothetical protein